MCQVSGKLEPALSVLPSLRSLSVLQLNCFSCCPFFKGWGGDTSISQSSSWILGFNPCAIKLCGAVAWQGVGCCGGRTFCPALEHPWPSEQGSPGMGVTEELECSRSRDIIFPRNQAV